LHPEPLITDRFKRGKAGRGNDQGRKLVFAPLDMLRAIDPIPFEIALYPAPTWRSPRNVKAKL
jgi:hypothetical protein